MRPLDGEGATQILLMGHRRLRITGMVNCYFLSGLSYARLHLKIMLNTGIHTAIDVLNTIDCAVDVHLNMIKAGY